MLIFAMMANQEPVVGVLDRDSPWAAALRRCLLVVSRYVCQTVFSKSMQFRTVSARFCYDSTRFIPSMYYF